jgi:hypothetical protein
MNKLLGATGFVLGAQLSTILDVFRVVVQDLPD